MVYGLIKVYKKKKEFHNHKLSINYETLQTINKIQKIPFSLNLELLNLLESNKSLIPDLLSPAELKKIENIRKEKNILLKELIKEKYKLAENQANMLSINEQLNRTKQILEDCTSKITKHISIKRILSGFNMYKNYKEFYYSYDLDFRMRLYPQQIELSPHGSKLSRSLIKFKEEFEFNYEEFICYAARLYKKVYVFTDISLALIFRNEVEPIFKKFMEEPKKILKEIFEEASEPYLFIGAAIEYKNYKLAEERGEKYYTGFPIIFDCSGSGPQILSLLFLLEEFTKYLNLEPNEERKDFYISIIQKFLKESIDIQSYIKQNLNQEEEQKLLIILRSCCKNVIMTQIYGVTYINAINILKKNFYENEKKLINYLNLDNKYYLEFIDNYSKLFWKFLRDLPLFKLKEFFQVYINLLKETDQELFWTVLDNSKITVNYQKYKKKKLDFKNTILGRIQYVHKEKIGIKDYEKFKTSAQANFIHSIDAAVNMYILNKHTSSIFSIHDAWGVGMGKSQELKKSLDEIYFKISHDNLVLKQLTTQFIDLLKKTVWQSAANSFQKLL